MLKDRIGKILLRAVILFVPLSLIHVINLNSKKSNKISTPIELIKVEYDYCFSPDEDNRKDNMILGANFKGKPNKKVYAFLFIKKGSKLIQIHFHSAKFSQTGEAAVAIIWDGKNWRKQLVFDGTYQLKMYFFTVPLYTRNKSQNPEKFYERLEKLMEKTSISQRIGRWDGEVVVDTVAPQLTITSPEENLKVFESSTETNGTIKEGDSLTINEDSVPLENNEFSTILNLNTVENTFKYILEDCAGNRDIQIRTITRIFDKLPPVITIPCPEEGGNYKDVFISIAVTYEDSGSGINQSSIKVTLNSVDITSVLTVSESGINGEIKNEDNLNNGTNSLVVEVSDNVGNTNLEAVNFNYEKITEDEKTIIYGRVFEAVSDNPLSGAVITSSGKVVQSDDNGYWKLQFGSGGTYKIKITKEGYTEVFRKIYLDVGKEGVVDDAYITLKDTNITPIGPDGGTHVNTDGTVEVIIPQGALYEVKNIQVTRIPSSKALPGDLNETDNLVYPISFIFCANFGPDDTTFSTPVKIRVQNTWGFFAGTEIPFAEWDKENQKWVPVSGMAKVDSGGNWLEAEVTHFSSYDINGPITSGGCHGVWYSDPYPDIPVCEFGSIVYPSNGTLKTDFSIPGIKLRGGDTSIGFVYNSSTSFPWKALRIIYYHDNAFVDTPLKTTFSTSSPLVANTGGGIGTAAVKAFSFNPPSNKYGMGSLYLSGLYPSGRFVKTGYNNVKFTVTNYYAGEYALVSSWGGMPSGSTGVSALKPAYYREKITKRVFMVSRTESSFGRGWSIRGLNKLHFEGNRIVVEKGSGDTIEFEKGINYADIEYGASFESSNEQVLNPDSMLMVRTVQEGGAKLETRFFMGTPTEFDQTFIIDLGQEREIYKIGIDFPKYWQIFNIWDYVKISTSIDNTNWDDWSQFGEPTLGHPTQGTDALDTRIKSPMMFSRSSRSVRYIKYQLGYPAVNSAHPGSMINRVYAIGSEGEYRNVDGIKWPRLEYDSFNQKYILTEYSGAQTIFNSNGLMIEKKDNQSRTITYQYNGDKISRIAYPEGVYIDFEYDGNGFINKVKDSSGRETGIVTDSSGNIIEVIYPDNTKQEFTYNNRGLMTMDKKGDAKKTYTWDEDKPILIKITLPNSGERTLNAAILKYLLNDLESGPDNLINFPLTLNESGLDSEAVYEDGRVIKYQSGKGWNSKTVNNQLKEKTYYAEINNNKMPVEIHKDADSWEITTIRYNEDLQVKKYETKLTDEDWVALGTINYPYAKNGQIRTVTTNLMEITYNTDHLISNVHSYGLNKTFTYDATKNLTQVLDEIQNKTTSYTYNASNDLIRIDYPDGKNNEITYNNLGLIMEVENNDDTKTIVTRNSRGEITNITDEENRTVVIDRDIMGRVIKETSPSGRIVQYEWGGSGCTSCGSDLKLTKIIDSGNKEWEFKYDIMGNPLEMIYPDDTKIIQEYDIAGRQSKFTNKRGQEIIYDYDGDGRLILKTTPEGDITFSYDNRDRVTDIIATDYHYKYQYGVCQVPYMSGTFTIVDERNELTGKWNQHVYNYWGLPEDFHESYWWRKKYTYNFNTGGGTPIGTTPISIGYYKKTYGAAWYRDDITYDGGYRKTKVYNNLFRREERYEYDTNGILNRMRFIQEVANQTLGDINFTRDNSGLITSTTGNKGLSAVYSQDLEIENIQHTIPQVFDESYNYDTKGNRLTTLTNNFTYNDLNQLTSTNIHTYTYDADGNMIEEKNITTTETKKYYYSSENRMIKYEHYPTDVEPADVIAEYKYDIYGRRMQKNVNGTITNFLWEGDNLSFELDKNFNPIRRYVYGMGKDEVKGHVEFAEAQGNVFDEAGLGWYSYIKDQVGTITQVYFRENYSMAETRTYDVFGNLISKTGSSNCNLGFQGKYFDQESGLYYYFHRYYYPTFGRFINEDPIGLNGGLNMYLFIDNDPLNYFDPFGLDKVKLLAEEMGKWFGWYWKWDAKVHGKINKILNLEIDWCKFRECMAGVASNEAKNQKVLSNYDFDYPRREMVKENPKRFWSKKLPGMHSKKLPDYMNRYKGSYKFAKGLSLLLLGLDVLDCLIESSK